LENEMLSPGSVRYGVALLIALVLPVALPAQVMPPVFRPLAPEAITLLRIEQDSLLQVVTDVNRRSLQMQENIQRLNQGEAVIGNLRAQAGEATARIEGIRVDSVRTAQELERVGQLERQGRADAAARDAEAEVMEARIAADMADGVLDDEEVGYRRGQAAARREDAARLRAEADRQSLLLAQLRTRLTNLGGRIESETRVRDSLLSSVAAIEQGLPIPEVRPRLEYEAWELEQRLAATTADLQRVTAAVNQAEGLRTGRILTADDVRVFYGAGTSGVAQNAHVAVRPGSAGAVSSEVVSGFFFIPLVQRGARGALMLTAAEARDDDDGGQAEAGRDPGAVQRLLTSGGNLVAYSHVPISFWESGGFSTTLQILPKVAIDGAIPRDQQRLRSVALNTDVGAELYLAAGQRGQGGFALIRAAGLLMNGALQNKIGVESPGAAYLQVTAGWEWRFFRVGLSGVFSGTDALRRDANVYVSLAPGG
jgi:hypothetical protein